MRTTSLPASNISDELLHAVLPGLLLATLTLLLGFGLGVVFGLNEEAITSRLAAAAAAAPASVYHADAAAIKAVLAKSWAYMQRSHLHAGALGTTAVALSLIVVLLGIRPLLARVISMAAGAGGLGYSLFWAWAGARAPGLGSTGVAKESLSWLAIPSSGLVVAATCAVAALLVLRLGRRPRGDVPAVLRPVVVAETVVACSRATPPNPAVTDSASARSGSVIESPVQRSAMLARAELAMFAVLPAAMPAPGAPASAAEVALGRRLFYETLLSNGHDVSCNSCHALNGYGADGRRVSFGSVGHVGGRNAPTVYNAAGHLAQFWDGRAATVEEQAKGPILNAVEMGMPSSDAVLTHLRASASYRAAFASAYPGQAAPINYDNVGRAIGAFERGLVTPSRWDAYLAGDSAALTPAERRGVAAFVQTGCASCHSGAYIGGQMYRRLGLVKPWPTATDSGRIAVTHVAADRFVFKVPSLRNVEQTAPYFHDGSVASLDSAIVLMARHQLGRELDTGTVASIRAWLGTLTGTLPAAYIAEPQLPGTP
jgi:cytochrome c peroxidase